MTDTTTLTAPAAAHIVLDLETLSTQPNALVLSIGATALDRLGNSVSNGDFYVVLKQAEQGAVRHISQSTIDWWEKQSLEAQQEAFKPTKCTCYVEDALDAFTDWIESITDPKQVQIWGNGSSFDNVILGSLYDAWHKERPWKFWNDRDMRTLLELHPHAKDVGPFDGIKHHALHDARHEAKQLAVVLKATSAPTDQRHVKFARLLDHPEVGQVLMRVETDTEEDEDKLTFTFRGGWLGESVGWTSFGFFFPDDDAPNRLLASMTDVAAISIVSQQIKEIREQMGVKA